MHHSGFKRHIKILIFSCAIFAFLEYHAVTLGQIAGKMPGNELDTIIIRQVTISGNKITKARIITRELNFKEHDTILLSRLSNLLITSRENVFNTRLFNFVTIDTGLSADRRFVDISVALVERWYIWPIPYVEISDRNFNV